MDQQSVISTVISSRMKPLGLVVWCMWEKKKDGISPQRAKSNTKWKTVSTSNENLMSDH